ncbi:MAG: AAA family ATPase [Pseudomonadota bacterium]
MSIYAYPAIVNAMITRKLTNRLLKLATYYPVVAVTGPRQAGKTTLCRAAFPEKPYVSLEALDFREFAQSDPRGFLMEYRQGAILDEIQQAPGLVSYLQTEVDEHKEPGRFILTGSQHFGISQIVSQSLAGRCGLLTLLPLILMNCRASPKSRMISLPYSGKVLTLGSMTRTFLPTSG